MARVIYADEHDEVASLRLKLESVDDHRIAIVVPSYNRALSSSLALRLLQRQAEDQALELSLISSDPSLRRIAQQEGLAAFSSLQSYRRYAEHGTGPFGIVLDAIASIPDHIRSIIASTSVLALFGLALAVLYVFVPCATVTLQPETIVVRDSVQVVADPGLRMIDFENHRVPSRTVRLLVEASDQAVTASDRDPDDESAVGMVTFTNNTSREMLVPRGTVVSTGNDVRFVTDEDITLAAGHGQTGRTRIVAIEPGSIGNVPRREIRNIEGILRYYIAVRNDEPTAGGGEQSSSVVTTDDREKLRIRVTERARQDALSRLAIEPRDGELLLQKSVEFTVLEVVFDRDVAEEASTLSVHLKARASGTIINRQDVETVVFQDWQPELDPGFDLIPESAQVMSLDIAEIDEGLTTLSVELEAMASARIDRELVRQYVRWRSPEDAESDLLQVFDLSSSPEIRIDPGWAGQAYRVRVEVDTGSERIGGR